MYYGLFTQQARELLPSNRFPCKSSEFCVVSYRRDSTKWHQLCSACLNQRMESMCLALTRSSHCGSSVVVLNWYISCEIYPLLQLMEFDPWHLHISLARERLQLQKASWVRVAANLDHVCIHWNPPICLAEWAPIKLCRFLKEWTHNHQRARELVVVSVELINYFNFIKLNDQGRLLLLVISTL